MTLSSYICTKLSTPHNQNNHNQYTCQYCKAIFKTKTELVVHHDDIHLGESIQDFGPGPSKIESNTSTVSQNLQKKIIIGLPIRLKSNVLIFCKGAVLKHWF